MTITRVMAVIVRYSTEFVSILGPTYVEDRPVLPAMIKCSQKNLVLSTVYDGDIRRGYREHLSNFRTFSKLFYQPKKG